MSFEVCEHEAMTASACPRCAAARWVACTACGAAMPEDSRFCADCGAPVEVVQGSDLELGGEEVEPAGERKPVTVLFVNAAHGSLDVSVALDPEEAHLLVTRFFSILQQGVRRAGGVVERFTGEGIKARFGAPIAHESHARQACEAALLLARELAAYGQELRRTRGINFTVRMGLNSGEALYGPVGASGAVTFSAQGHVAALAARMEQLAEPGRIFLTATTAALVREYFELADLGAFAIRGVREPLRVHELVDFGEHESRLEVARARGFTPFVGRADELARLESILGEVCRSGRPRVVGIVGEPGVGKSRLAHEFASHCRSRGIGVHQFRILEGERETPFALGRRFVRGLLGITDRDDAETARTKAVRQLLAVDPKLRETLAVAYDVLGVSSPGARPPSGYEPRVQQLATIVLRVVEARLRSPVLYAFDDRHWSDAATEAISNAVFSHGFESPALVLMIMRPGYRQPWMELPLYSELRLSTLPREAMEELVQRVLGTDPSLEEIREDLRERSGGNPFFMEELIRALIDGGVVTGEPGAYRLAGERPPPVLPPGLRALLAARLDHLPLREKQVLQAAAVVGTRFTAALLQRITGLAGEEVDLALEALVAMQLVDRDVEDGSHAFHFRQELMRESAELSLLRGRRVRLHAEVARAIGDEAGDDPGRQAGEIASHWERAADPLRAARWHRRAAHWAAPRDPAQALARWEKVRTLCPAIGDADQRAELLLSACLGQLQLGWHQGVPAGEAAALFAEGRRLAQERADARSLALLTATYGDIRSMAGHVDEAVRLGNEARGLAARSGEPGLVLVLRSRLALTLYEAGDLRATLATATADDAAVADAALGRADLGFSPAVHLTMIRGLALLDMGRFAEGRSALEAAARRARDAGDRQGLCMSVAALGAYPRLTGIVPDDLLPRLREAVEIAETTGSHFLRVATRAGHGIVAHMSGALDEAKATAEAALAIVEHGGVSFHNESTLLSMLALVSLALGDRERALACCRRARDVLRGRRCLIWEIDAILRWGRVTVAIGSEPPEVVLCEIGRARALVERTGAQSRVPLLLAVTALARARLGDREAARADCRSAIALCEQLGATGIRDAFAMLLAERLPS